MEAPQGSGAAWAQSRAGHQVVRQWCDFTLQNQCFARDVTLLSLGSDSSSGERQVVGGGIPDIDDPKFELLRIQDREIVRFPL